MSFVYQYFFGLEEETSPELPETVQEQEEDDFIVLKTTNMSSSISGIDPTVIAIAPDTLVQAEGKLIRLESVLEGNCAQGIHHCWCRIHQTPCKGLKDHGGYDGGKTQKMTGKKNAKKNRGFTKS